MCHMCGNGAEGNVWGRGGAKRACGRGQGQLVHSMGPVWREVHILEQMPIMPSKGLFYFYFNCHTCANNLLYMWLICFSAIHIFLLCRLKINFVTEIQNMHLLVQLHNVKSHNEIVTKRLC